MSDLLIYDYETRQSKVHITSVIQILTEDPFVDNFDSVVTLLNRKHGGASDLNRNPLRRDSRRNLRENHALTSTSSLNVSLGGGETLGMNQIPKIGNHKSLFP